MSMVAKKVPLRRCVGCGERKAKRDMVRIVRTAEEGNLEIDARGKMAGRGCYVCPTESCITAGLSRNKIAHALRMDVLSPQARDELRERIEDSIDNDTGEVRR